MTTQKRPRGRPKSQFTQSSAATLQSLDRALGALTALARMEAATLTDLSLTLGVPTATVHRILTTLQRRGFVAFDEDRQVWMIGLEAYRVGVTYLKRSRLTEVGRPVMRTLMEQTGETANLAIQDGSEVVFIGQVETSNPIRAFFAPGTRTPMHASGTGKAILSRLPRERVERLLTGPALERFTASTLSTPADLYRDLDATRERGWSFDREERHEGMSCIGSAIFDETGRPGAGISISGPSARFSPDRRDGLGKAVRAAAQEITRLSGGAAPDG